MFQIWNPKYMNPICLLEMVKDSSPAHYDVHPLWKYYLRDVDQTCVDQTGMGSRKYFDYVWHGGVFEYYVFQACFWSYGAYGLFRFCKQIYDGRVKSFIGLLAALFLAWNQFSLFHLLAHYQNDCYHINGNVMHHSGYTHNGSNAALVKTLPPGLIISFSLNFFTTYAIFYVIMDAFGLDHELYFNILGALISTPIIFGFTDFLPSFLRLRSLLSHILLLNTHFPSPFRTYEYRQDGITDDGYPPFRSW